MVICHLFGFLFLVSLGSHRIIPFVEFRCEDWHIDHLLLLLPIRTNPLNTLIMLHKHVLLALSIHSRVDLRKTLALVAS